MNTILKIHLRKTTLTEEYKAGWENTPLAIIGRGILLPFMQRHKLQWQGLLYEELFLDSFAYRAARHLVNGGFMLAYAYEYEGQGLAKKQFYTYYKMKYNAARNEVRIYQIPGKQHERLLKQFSREWLR